MMNKNKYGQPFMSVLNFPVYMIANNHLHVKNATDFEIKERIKNMYTWGFKTSLEYDIFVGKHGALMFLIDDKIETLEELLESNIELKQLFYSGYKFEIGPGFDFNEKTGKVEPRLQIGQQTQKKALYCTNFKKFLPKEKDFYQKPGIRPSERKDRKDKRNKDNYLQKEILRILEEIYGGSRSALEYESVYQLLVAVILSAQTNDNQVNKITGKLFQLYPDAEAMSALEPEELEPLIATCGLYKNKAKNIVATSRILCREYGGVVPADREKLMQLPGVGRKIANLLRGDLYGLPAIVADTHCIRICGRLGFYPESLKDPVAVERIMTALVEPAEQSDFCHRLVLFGRDICRARSPLCGECPLADVCGHLTSDSE